ncbi:MAG: DUF58 domain-containing protein [Lachnospiraceae bacterium]|nr:DUF58 domain-containing protein [Lachnospiraceae bacterium]
MSIILLVFVVYAICIVSEYLFDRYWNHNLKIDMEFSKNEAYVGEKLRLNYTVVNNKPMALPLIQLKFNTSRYLDFYEDANSTVTDNSYHSELISIGGNQVITQNNEFICTHRGEFVINEVDLITYNMFLSNKSIIKFHTDINLIVFPKIVETEMFNFTFKGLLGDILSTRRLIDDPFDFRGIRDYQTFDSMKSINWSASARSLGLKVNVYNYTASQKIRIIANIDNDLVSRHDDLSEACISLAASFAYAFLKEGIETSCYCNALNKKTKKLIAIPGGTGKKHLDYILFSLARLDISEVKEDFTTLTKNLIKDCSENEWLLIISASRNKELQKAIIETFPNPDEVTLVVPTYSSSRENQPKWLKNVINWYIDD